jgi:hypothetical protein
LKPKGKWMPASNAIVQRKITITYKQVHLNSMEKSKGNG